VFLPVQKAYEYSKFWCTQSRCMAQYAQWTDSTDTALCARSQRAEAIGQWDARNLHAR